MHRTAREHPIRGVASSLGDRSRLGVEGVEPCAQFGGGLAWALGADDGGADGDPACAGFEHLVEVLEGDAADGEPGERRGRGGLADEVQAGELRLGEVLGRAGEDRADSQVACAVEDRPVELVAVVRRDADQGVGADDPPGVAGRQVVAGRGGRRRRRRAGPGRGGRS